MVLSGQQVLELLNFFTHSLNSPPGPFSQSHNLISNRFNSFQHRLNMIKQRLQHIIYGYLWKNVSLNVGPFRPSLFDKLFPRSSIMMLCSWFHRWSVAQVFNVSLNAWNAGNVQGMFGYELWIMNPSPSVSTMPGSNVYPQIFDVPTCSGLKDSEIFPRMRGAVDAIRKSRVWYSVSEIFKRHTVSASGRFTLVQFWISNSVGFSVPQLMSFWNTNLAQTAAPHGIGEAKHRGIDGEPSHVSVGWYFDQPV